MPVFDTFSKRQARLKGEVTDVYTYDVLDRPLRVQLARIIGDVYGNREFESQGSYTDGYKRWRELTYAIRREFGMDLLPPRSVYASEQCIEELGDFIKDGASHAQVLDVIDMFIQDVSVAVAKATNPPYIALRKAALDEITTRFKDAGMGYSVDNGRLFRVDSQFMHVEAVKPALVLLADPAYAGPQAEFLNAFAHYKDGKNKEALTDALKAFESTMKVISAKTKWTVGGQGTAKDLIATCFANGLIPTFWQNHFTGIRTTLEGGVPTARNKTSGHGQGTQVQDVPDHVARYVLYLTASTIIMLVNAEKVLP